MDDKHLATYLLKVFTELENRITKRVLDGISQALITANSQTNEKTLTDAELCEALQISTSHFYKLKKGKSDFPTYNYGGVKRYKLSEVESYFKTLKSTNR